MAGGIGEGLRGVLGGLEKNKLRQLEEEAREREQMRLLNRLLGVERAQSAFTDIGEREGTAEEMEAAKEFMASQIAQPDVAAAQEKALRGLLAEHGTGFAGPPLEDIIAPPEFEAKFPREARTIQAQRFLATAPRRRKEQKLSGRQAQDAIDFLDDILIRRFGQTGIEQSLSSLERLDPKGKMRFLDELAEALQQNLEFRGRMRLTPVEMRRVLGSRFGSIPAIMAEAHAGEKKQ